MNTITTLLIIAASAQLAVAIINLRLERLLHWQTELAAMPLLLREVFHVHKWFISLTLAIFAVLTFRFASQLASDPLGRWLAGGIAVFWGFRTVLQVAYYSSSHWRNDRARTVAHITLLVLYGGMAALYAWTATGGN